MHGVLQSLSGTSFGNVMRMALILLCIGAVTFLLWILAALVREATNKVLRDMQLDLATFRPTNRRQKLMLVNPAAQKGTSPPGTGKRIA